MNMPNNNRSNAPSIRDNWFTSLPYRNTSKHNAMNTSAENKLNGISTKSARRPTGTVVTIAVTPNIASVLKMLLPTIFPADISALPFSAENILTTNSGRLVPKATTVRPITTSLTRSRRAKPVAPSTIMSAPFSIMAIPNTIHKISSAIVLSSRFRLQK